MDLVTEVGPSERDLELETQKNGAKARRFTIKPFLVAHHYILGPNMNF